MLNFNSKLGKKVKRMLDSEYIVWLTTVSSDLTPQPRPVWFTPEDDGVLIYSQAHAHKIVHIRTHPRVSLHFNTDREAGDTVIVLTGTAAVAADAPTANENPAYLQKYKKGIAELDMKLEDFGRDYSVPIRIKLTGLRGW
ncbi:MAG: TIGR03667 family PPOX class F420-dependent oxidoreductase [Anaerolineales bacterium]